MTQVGLRVCMGNDGGHEPVAPIVAVGDGEADAIDRNTAFAEDIAGDGIAIGGEGHFPGSRGLSGGLERTESIDVAGDEVATEFAADAEGGFEIHDFAAAAGTTQGRSAQSLGGNHRHKAIAQNLGDGEADAIDGDAIADFQTRENLVLGGCGAGDLDMFGVEQGELADSLN